MLVAVAVVHPMMVVLVVLVVVEVLDLVMVEDLVVLMVYRAIPTPVAEDLVHQQVVPVEKVDEVDLVSSSSLIQLNIFLITLCDSTQSCTFGITH